MTKFKKFSNPYPMSAHYSANTLKESDLGTHSNGWTVSGKLQEDYYTWVNYFEASHPEYGTVRGDFEEDILEATSKLALDKFCEEFAPEAWDYEDI